LFLFFILIVCLSNGWFFDMPDINSFEHPTQNISSQIFAQDGSSIGKYYIEDRITLDYRELNPNIIKALVCTEDRRFYYHNGIDFESLLRALVFLGVQGGGSTLTQQTAKNLFTENWTTKNKFLRILQKIKEFVIAIKLERYFTKEEIVTIYLNSVVFSENVFGIKNAAKTFFQKQPNQLTISEAALLVGMINAPTLYNPRKNPRLALERRNLVINRLMNQRFISINQGKLLKKEPIRLFYQKLDENAGLAPYFRMIVGEELKKWCKENKKNNGENYNLYTDGLKIYTTLNLEMQQIAENAVEKQMKRIQNQFNLDPNIKDGLIWKKKGSSYILNLIKNTARWRGLKGGGLNDDQCLKEFSKPVQMRIFSWKNPKHFTDTIMSPFDSVKYYRSLLQSAFMVMDPFSGEIKAWVGGIDFKSFKFDHVNINTKRQVGSTIKPLLYSFAIQSIGLSPYSLVEDVQQSFDGYNKVPATQRTCSGETITMAEALAQSKNCATAYILKSIDSVANNSAVKFAEFLKTCGVSSKLEPYPSIALGAEEISLYEMMQAYSMIPGHGYNTKPFYITRIEDKNGNLLASYSPQRKKLITQKNSDYMIEMMEGVMSHGSGASIWNYNINFSSLAGKTGTTNNNSDMWFIGFTPNLLAGAWVGCDDRNFVFNNNYWGQGAHGALPIWAYFFQELSLNNKNNKQFELQKDDDPAENEYFINNPNAVDSTSQQ
ncbi:MAG: transglycosylase domain-containing protein, partial [Sediminibacterium sp.]|nr:transglycosylase domain-containing protein [Sediminibacterium sp.]